MRLSAVLALRRRELFILSGAFFILLLASFAPPLPGLSPSGQRMVGIMLIAVIFWITEVIPLPVTGLLVMLLQPLLGAMTAAEVFANFGNPAVFFLLGSLMLASAVEKHGLHRRVALWALAYFERSPRWFIFGVMAVGALLSFAIEEHAVAALLLPILMHILVTMRLIPRQSNFGKATMLALTYGTSIGSWGTLLGGARNPLTVGFLSEMFGYEVTFLGWMRMSFPVVLFSLPLVWLILIKLFPPEVQAGELQRAREEVSREVRRLGPLRRPEWLTLGVYLLTIGMWMGLSSHLGVAVVAMIGATLLFLLRLVSWEDIESRVNWGIILLYGGAITLGIGLERTGAAEWLARGLLFLAGDSPYLALLIVIIFAFLLTEMMSNTAAVALMLPIGLGLARSIPGLSPIATSFVIALSGGGAFLLVTATPSAAIAYSSGYFSPRDLLRTGLWTVVLCVGVIFLVATTYWRFIGLW